MLCLQGITFPSLFQSIQITKPPTLSVVFVQHGEPQVDQSSSDRAASRNRHDPPLSKKGKAEVRRQALMNIFPFHASINFSCIYTSPYRACVETAAAIATELDIPVQIVSALGSCASTTIHAGGIDHVPLDTTSKHAAEHPAVTFLEADDRIDLSDFLAVCARLAQAHVDASMAQAPPQRILIVGHGEGVRSVQPARPDGRVPLPLAHGGAVEMEYDSAHHVGGDHGPWAFKDALL